MNNSTFVHKYLTPLIERDSVCVDMTAGGGNDTLFLAQHSDHVIAFDISKEAIERSKKRCAAYPDILFICDSHENIRSYLKEKADVILFNLGYDPYGERNTPTKSSSSLKAVKEAWDLLKEEGYLVITFYRGHPGGKDEYYVLKDYIEKNGLFVLETYQRHLKIDEPVTYILKKIS